MRLALALLCAFFLAGWPRVSNAQNGNVKVGDATLEEFMAAFANAFENAHYITVTPSDTTGLGPAFYTVPIDYNGIDMQGYLEWDGATVAAYTWVVAQIMRQLESAGVSNVVEKLNNFVDGAYSYTNREGRVVLSELAEAINNLAFEVGRDLPSVAEDTDLVESMFYDVLTEDAGNFANPRMGLLSKCLTGG